MDFAIGFVLFVMAVSGVIGALLGSSVNKGLEGFFLGFFLSGIGWIIVLLLPRETSNSPQAPKERPSSQAKAAKERPPRDLTSDEYKVFLGKKYEITRNELFDKFESDGKLFESLDAALKYADELEAQDPQRLEVQKAEERQRLIDKEKEKEKEKEKKKTTKKEKKIMKRSFKNLFSLSFEEGSNVNVMEVKSLSPIQILDENKHGYTTFNQVLGVWLTSSISMIQ